MSDAPVDWRTEIAIQVGTLARDDRVMKRFRAMCLEFSYEKK